MDNNLKPVIEGEWLIYKEDELSKEHMKCSRCGAYWSNPSFAKTFKRCYECGAHMNSIKVLGVIEGKDWKLTSYPILWKENSDGKNSNNL